MIIKTKSPTISGTFLFNKLVIYLVVTVVMIVIAVIMVFFRMVPMALAVFDRAARDSY